MRDKIGIPDPSPDEEVLVARAPAQSTGAVKVPPPAKDVRQSAHSMSANRQTDAIDDTADDQSSEWAELVGPIISELGDQIAAAQTIEEAQAILAARFVGMDANTLAERLAKAVFAARLSGEADEPLF